MVARTDSQNRNGKAVGLEAIVGPLSIVGPLFMVQLFLRVAAYGDALAVDAHRFAFLKRQHDAGSFPICIPRRQERGPLHSALPESSRAEPVR